MVLPAGDSGPKANGHTFFLDIWEGDVESTSLEHLIKHDQKRIIGVQISLSKREQEALQWAAEGNRVPSIVLTFSACRGDEGNRGKRG